ncbi:hypothetical protein RHSIM_Rhsim02G0174600 [Rhododendron simsii]|uniref:Helitron helicase-like domain-containing protein n=1 Tax=Rhododendron simsii TaxID=118357 RepID=A0A834HCF2_RHOSS|nr:hypothetical protein RHSIM_Rhsim02G0174600 [Rhododendron simsii]
MAIGYTPFSLPTPTSELLQEDAYANDGVEGVLPRVTQLFICPTSIPSTSYAPQRSTPTSELLQEDACPSKVNEPKVCQHSIPHIEESVAMPSIDMNEPEMCHLAMPPQNLEDEFLAVATAHASHAQYIRVLNGRGPLSFTIHGELRHRTGSLLPQPRHEAIYSQLYIYDPVSSLNARNNRNPHLRRDVLKTIQDCLLTINPFFEKFLRAFEILNQSESVGQNLPAYLHYSSSTDHQRYNLPTADEIAIILPGDGTEKSGMRDIVLHLRENNGLM